MRSQKTQKRTSDALALVEELTGKSQEMADLVEQEQDNLDIARKIYELRTKAKLSQAESGAQGWHDPIRYLPARRCGLRWSFLGNVAPHRFRA